jgi:hypothetical protein
MFTPQTSHDTQNKPIKVLFTKRDKLIKPLLEANYLNQVKLNSPGIRLTENDWFGSSVYLNIWFLDNKNRSTLSQKEN